MKGLIVSLDGHDKHEWDVNNPEDMAEIKKLFKEKVEEADFRAFAVTKDGESHRITKFDKTAERIIMTAEKFVMFTPNRGG